MRTYNLTIMFLSTLSQVAIETAMVDSAIKMRLLDGGRQLKVTLKIRVT